MKNTSQKQPHTAGKHQFTSLLVIYLALKKPLGGVCVCYVCAMCVTPLYLPSPAPN